MMLNKSRLRRESLSWCKLLCSASNSYIVASTTNQSENPVISQHIPNDSTSTESSLNGSSDTSKEGSASSGTQGKATNNSNISSKGPPSTEAIWKSIHSKYKKPVFRTPVDNKGVKIPEGLSNSSTNDDDLRRDLKEKIWKAQINKSPTRLMESIIIARRHRIELDQKDYNAALWACSEITDDRNLEAYWIYDVLKLHPNVPMSVFHSLLKVCLIRSDAPMALKVMKDYNSLGYEMTEQFLCDFLSCLARGRSTNVDEILNYYQLFRDLSKEKGWQGTQMMYLDVLQNYIRQAQTSEVLLVLGDMAASNFEPSLEVCCNLLGIALFHADSKILLVLANWLSNKFQVNLEYGVLCRMLQVSACTGDPQLAQITMQLLSKSGHAPRQSDYSCWIRACVHGQDFVGAVEALMEAHAHGIDMLASSEANANAAGDLQEVLAFGLSRSVRKLDDVYFALVELVRANYNVPPMAVTGVIMAAGRMGQIDRAFATFQEYQTLFNLTPDVHAFNALLWAGASFRDANISTLLSVFQEMESAGVKPDSFSFTILLQSMADCEDLSSLGPVLDLIVSSKIKVRARALRCVAVCAAKQSDLSTVAKIKGIMASQHSPLPKFFNIRLQDICSVHNGSGVQKT